MASFSRRVAAVFVLLVAITAVSQFYRASSSVIAPELIADLGLTPASLGSAGAAFFLALGILQLPIGILFDRYGPRRTIAVLTVIAVGGALLHAAAWDEASFILARLVIGIGCAGSFMGTVVLCSRWFPGDRLATMLSWVFALSNLGTLCAAAPLAELSTAVGWRLAFVIAAGLTGAIGLLFLAVVADRRPGEREEAAAPPSLAEALRGVAEVWRSPGLAGVAAVHAFAYASMLTLLGVWSGPYLHDVFGLDTVARGRILTAMGAAQILGILCYGPLDRLLNSRKRVVLGGVGGSVAILALLALLPAPPLWLAAALLIGYCFVTAYGVVIVAHGRSLFPDHLVGRGVTTVNLAQVFGATILPFATGLIVQGFDDGGGAIPAIAYRFSFAFIAVALAAGATVYSRLPDSRPRTA